MFGLFFQDMSGQQRFEEQHGHAQQDTSLTLTELLECKQPYKEIKRLNDAAVESSAADDGNETLRRIQGSLVGLAIGDALGASVEFRPNSFLKEHEVTDMQGGGTWGLETGQWTDDTSMALCLAASLIIKGKFDPYDQFVRYKRWYRDGYMSSTGKCFDIGKSTRDAITSFEECQNKTRDQIRENKPNMNDADLDRMVEKKICDSNTRLRFATKDSAGNGSLMRLAPIPCFFWESYDKVKACIDEATEMTHDDPRARDACRFYAGLIWHALQGELKDQLLSKDFYKATLGLKLHPDIQEIAEGSYKTKKGYEGGIRGKGFVVNSLEAALWAFHNDEGKFNKGVLLAVNLGDDTDTTAAIYGQLAGACYKVDRISEKWRNELYEKDFIMIVAKGLYIKEEGLSSNSKQSKESGQTRTHVHEHEKNGTKKPGQDRPSGPTAASPSPNTNPADQSNRGKPQDPKNKSPPGSSENSNSSGPDIKSRNTFLEN